MRLKVTIPTLAFMFIWFFLEHLIVAVLVDWFDFEIGFGGHNYFTAIIGKAVWSVLTYLLFMSIFKMEDKK